VRRRQRILSSRPRARIEHEVRVIAAGPAPKVCEGCGRTILEPVLAPAEPEVCSECGGYDEAPSTAYGYGPGF
jgi:hypothetical protein